MKDQEKEALDLIGTFLRAHYHEVRWNIDGTSDVLGIWPPDDPYRKDLSRGFRLILSAPLPEGTLTKLVQYEANRLVQNDVEAHEYLQGIYDDVHLDWEEEED